MTELRHKEAIKRLAEHTGNNECAECFSPEPGYASISLGIFLCPVCAKIHQKCLNKSSAVVPILNHSWTKEEVDHMHAEGNKIVNAKYEKYLPIFYHRPRQNDPVILFEQWVLAKYSRQEFQDRSRQREYSRENKTGALFKRLKDQEKFQRRKFILNVQEGKFMYFIKYSDKTPKDTILIRNLVNVYLVPEKLGNENGMQITYEKDGVRRNLYVFGENGKITTDWYHALRSAMARVKYKDFQEDDAKKYLNSTIIMEGWMAKTGPKKHEKFRRRWFSLVGTAIWYYSQPLDAHPLGYIPLGSKTFGYAVLRGFPKGIREDGYGLTIHTPERVYVLNCSNQSSRDKWNENIEQVLVSCTSLWKKPAAKIDKTSEKIVNLDDLDDLDKPSRSSVFTDMPAANGDKQKIEKIIDLDRIDDLKTPSVTSMKDESPSESSNQRTPLFVKNTRNRKDANNMPKTSLDKKGKHGGTVKIRSKVNDNEDTDEITETSNQKSDPALRNPSKRYSDDSECSGSEVEIVPSYTSSMHPRTHQLISSADSESSKGLSSATDEDSEEEVVVVRRRKQNDGNHSRNSSIRHSFPRLSPRSQSPKPTLSPLARPKSTLADLNLPRNSPPKKPPRKRFTRVGSSSSDLDKDTKPSEFEILHRQNFPLSADYMSKDSTFSIASLVTPEEEEPEKSFGMSGSPSNSLPSSKGAEDWRSTTFSKSVRRVEGKERISLRKADARHSAICISDDIEANEAPCRPIDVTICNKSESKIWFMLFQCEEEKENDDSYCTPWVGAEIAEMPASVGPIRLPSEFEIAVIDTAPGGFGLQRTTGPFYAEPGDVWEVDMPLDDGSAPDMFYHEGMETDDESVLVYSNVENSKNFEIALFKCGRKLFSRKNIKPGDSAAFKVDPSLYIMKVNQSLYFTLENDDIKVSDITSKSSEVKLDYRMPKLKICARKKDDKICFSSKAHVFSKKFESEPDSDI